jgi:hypothetical protein
MGETLETFRTLCYTIPIYSLPYVADGLLQLGNIILSAFPNPCNDAWPVFRNALPAIFTSAVSKIHLTVP